MINEICWSQSRKKCITFPCYLLCWLRNYKPYPTIPLFSRVSWDSGWRANWRLRKSQSWCGYEKIPDQMRNERNDVSQGKDKFRKLNLRVCVDLFIHQSFVKFWFNRVNWVGWGKKKQVVKEGMVPYQQVTYTCRFNTNPRLVLRYRSLHLRVFHSFPFASIYL